MLIILKLVNLILMNKKMSWQINFCKVFTKYNKKQITKIRKHLYYKKKALEMIYNYHNKI